MIRPRLGAVCIILGLTAASASGQAATVVRPDTGHQSVNDLHELSSSGMVLTVGTARSGNLSADDYIWIPDGSHMQVWDFRPEIGRQVSVDLRSDDFDSYLWITGPGIDEADDDGAGGCNSRITFTPRSTDGYRVIVNSLSGGATGSFSLSASHDPAPPDPESCDPSSLTDTGGWEPREGSEAFRDLLRDLPTFGRVLDIGAEYRAHLGPNSETVNVRYADAWTLEVAAGEIAVIDLISTDFDTYLWAVGPDFMLIDDDGAGSCNARITLSPRDRTRYTVVASSFAGHAEGHYLINVAEVPGPPREGSCGSDPYSDTMDLFATATPRGRIETGVAVTGDLTEGGELTVEDRFFHVWELRGEAGEDLAIEVSSTEFDTFVWLVGGGVELFDDDGGGNCNSTITTTLPRDGDFLVVVSSFSPYATGSYRLAVSSQPGDLRPGGCGDGEGLYGGYPPEIDVLPPVGTVQVGADRFGMLTEDDDLGRGSIIQVWLLDGRADGPTYVEVTSTDFDPFIWLIGNGVELADDDGAGNCNSMLAAALPSDGSYRIAVGSYGGNETGAYRVRVGTEPGPPEEGTCDIPAGGGFAFAGPFSGADLAGLSTEGRTIEMDSQADGFLSVNDQEMSDGSFAQAWSVHAAPGTEITIDLTSEDFDPLMGAFGPEFPLAIDDDGGAGLNSRLSLVMPEDGLLTLIVGSFSPGQTGAFTLRLR